MPHKQILDNLTVAVIMLDQHLQIDYINPAAEMLLEASARQLRRRHIREWFCENGEDLGLLEASLRSNHPYTCREARLTTQGQHALTVDYSVNPLQHEGETQLLIEMVAKDRLIRIEREEELLSRHETAKTLVRGLAHEIKNPLGGLRGAAQLLERELPDESLHDYTRIIIEEADRLRNLVDRLLGPRTLPEITQVNIHAVLERVASLIDAESRGMVRLSRDYDPSIPELTGDAEQLIQAVLNVVRNSMQALTRSDTTEPEIHLRTRTLRQFTLASERHRLVCCVEISDNGPGIPAEILQRIFYPMVSGTAQGSGLGLSIAQSIINQHQGLIECTSEPGHTCFKLFIPLELNHDNGR
ncbi:MAG: nitrogen regulation protein NR(II) [Marinobacterium sp.]|nr:nitrogen regulation protein NR(II) [Marinobacterium sp.]